MCSRPEGALLEFEAQADSTLACTEGRHGQGAGGEASLLVKVLRLGKAASLRHACSVRFEALDGSASLGRAGPGGPSGDYGLRLNGSTLSNVSTTWWQRGGVLRFAPGQASLHLELRCLRDG